MIGIYIHVPFCASFCNYCNFYSVKRLAQSALYPRALRKEMEQRLPAFLAEHALSAGQALSAEHALPAGHALPEYTLYLGGGTPSVLGIEGIGEITGAVREIIEQFHAAAGLQAPAAFSEVTVEVNPDDITPQFASALRSTGVNRVSIGFQSLHNSNLEWMGRRHNAKQAIRAYRLLRDAGIGNISIDLIFGYTGLTQELWRQNLEQVIELGPEHISGYQMSIEPSTPLGKAYERGEYKMPSQEECSREYALMQQMLCTAGYRQYEISNFALPGFEAMHNSNYWNGTPYIGFGPGAHSFSGIKRDSAGLPYASRCWNSPNLAAYMRGQLRQGSEKLDAKELFNEAIMLGLRTAKGVDTALLDPHLLKATEPMLQHYLRTGKMGQKGTVVYLKSDCLFIADSIIRELMII